MEGKSAMHWKNVKALGYSGYHLGIEVYFADFKVMILWEIDKSTHFLMVDKGRQHHKWSSA